MSVESLSVQAPLKSKSVFVEGWMRTFNRPSLEAEEIKQCLLPVTACTIELWLANTNFSKNATIEGLQLGGFIIKSIIMPSLLVLSVTLDGCASIPGRYIGCTIAAALEKRR